MPSQTRYFQNDILQAALRRGDLQRLFWYVEAEFPRRLLPAGIKRRQPAQWPHGCIPVLAAGPDVEEQRVWVELLAELFAAGNRNRGIVFAPALTTVDLLQGLRWYEYGEAVPYQLDHICMTCGQVQRAPAGSKPRCECYEW